MLLLLGLKLASLDAYDGLDAARALLEHIDDLDVREAAQVDAVDVEEHVALGELATALLVEYLLDLLAAELSVVGDGEAEAARALDHRRVQLVVLVAVVLVVLVAGRGGRWRLCLSLLLLLLFVVGGFLVRIVDGGERHDLDVGIVRVDGERIAATHGQLDGLADRYGLEDLDDVLVRVAEHALAVHVDEHVALAQLAVATSRAVGHDVLDLQEVVARLVGADDREAEAVRRLQQRRVQKLAAQSVRIAREINVPTPLHFITQQNKINI